MLRPVADLAALGIETRLGVAAEALDVDGRALHLADGSAVHYDDVVIATGASPRRLPGLDRDGVHVLRTLDDCLRLGAALRAAGSVVVIGAGFIGLEVAASARALGCAVTAVDVLTRPLARVLPAEIAETVRQLHVKHGVDVRCGVGVAEVVGSPVEAVVLTDGTRLPADVIVVGIGVAPATDWLAGSAVGVDDGVSCDENLRAAAGVWAVGDVARWQLPEGGTARLEHWTNATEQPHAVAAAITSGTTTAYTSVPYFWSDQYDAKLQSLGHVGPDSEPVLVFGSFDEPKWVALLRAGDRLAGVVGMRSPGRVMKLRPLLVAGATWREALDVVG
jgi:NADPH-dependent 2,4-dienoyl-CoA reductase/sulfur reductase-like enzyme